jgi:hypothetical protein
MSGDSSQRGMGNVLSLDHNDPKDLANPSMMILEVENLR